MTDHPTPAGPARGGHHETRPEDRVPWREKLGLGLGNAAAGCPATLHTLINPIFNMTLGMSPALISTVLFIQRLWDAFTDPLIGQFSDNFRSRRGRRLPLMAASALPMSALFFALWWFPRGAGETWLFFHLLVVSLAFYSVQTFYSMSLMGLRIEATDDYHERTRVAMIAMVFGFVFQISSQWLFPLTRLEIFGDPVTGLRNVMLVVAAIYLLLALLPVWLCRERNYERVAARQPRLKLRESLRHVWHNPPLKRVVASRLIESFGYNIVGMFAVYMNNYYVFGGDLQRAAWAYGFMGSAFMLSAVGCSVFVYPALSKRLGKKRTFQIAVCVLMAGCLAKLVVYQPGLPWLQLVVLVSNGAAISGIALMGASMLGDIADYEEWRTGRRNEAFLASILSWCDKAGSSLGSLICGFILVWIGFDAQTGAQGARTLGLMKFFYFLMPFAGALAAFFIMRNYELDEDRVYEIKAELARRRATSSPLPSTQPASPLP
ncbi:sodium:melibiose symporter [Opitutaceae bacterium TAV5]|nr:sodium:melibiose symporter [Opitutaceae bacterium TAV5]